MSEQCPLCFGFGHLGRSAHDPCLTLEEHERRMRADPCPMCALREENARLEQALARADRDVLRICAENHRLGEENRQAAEILRVVAKGGHQMGPASAWLSRKETP